VVPRVVAPVVPTLALVPVVPMAPVVFTEAPPLVVSDVEPEPSEVEGPPVESSLPVPEWELSELHPNASAAAAEKVRKRVVASRVLGSIIFVGFWGKVPSNAATPAPRTKDGTTRPSISGL
jgi:hypothetical protein